MAETLRWRPSAALEILRKRAVLLERLREHMRERGFLEVETPLLSRAASPEPHVESLEVPGAFADGADGWLITSPEFHLKRLVADGAGNVYAVARVFRAGEDGRLHNLEFTLVEWYRLGAGLAQLMDDIEALLADLLPPAWSAQPAERLSYREAFRRCANVDPFDSSLLELRRAARSGEGASRNDLLDRLAAERVYPQLGRLGIAFVYDFPAAQASLARIRLGEPPLAERVEAVVGGIELVNGFVELGDPDEQRQRFERDLATRRRAGRTGPATDERFLAALASGLPPCAGAALGFDRLVMLALGAQAIRDVQAFSADRA